MSIESLRAKALNGPVRFETFEHDGEFYAVRQSNAQISKELHRYKDDPHGRTVELVIQVTHEALPVLDGDGKQLTEETFVPATTPVLDEKGAPVTEPLLDPKGRPYIVDGKPLLRAKVAPLADQSGSPVLKPEIRLKFTLGKRVFGRTDFDALMETANDQGSFIEKVATAAVKVNDREEAGDRAKKR